MKIQQFMLGAILFGTLLSNLVWMPISRGDEKKKNERSAWELVVRDAIEQERRRDAVFPKIEQGKVVGGIPKTEAMLNFIIEDYRNRQKKSGGKLQLTYQVAVGASSGDYDVTGTGIFKKGTWVPAEFSMVLGGNVKETKSGIILGFLRNNAGSQSFSMQLEWGDTTRKWNVVRLSDADPNSKDVMTPDEIN